MKLRQLPTLCAALLALCPILATAQTSAVPGFISYQGRVVDASGANVGAGTPVNRTVIFRIWDNPSSTNAANLIYSEAQTVTVSEGEFSVLVGQGVANTTQTYGYLETTKKLADIGSAFGGSTRYLGVTVAAAGTIATTDNEITPRQQIVSTAFAMRAKVAESVDSLAITSAMLANNSVTTTQLGEAAITTSKIATNAVTTTQIADGTITAAKIAAGTIATANIAESSITTAKIADNSITTAKIADNSITTAKIADGTIAMADLADSSITSAKIDDSTIATADLADSSITTAKIANATIATADLADSSITTAKIANATIASADIATDTILATNIAAGAVGTSELATGVNISAGTISTTGVVKIDTTTSLGMLNVGTKTASWDSFGKLTSDGAFNTNEPRDNQQLSIVADGFMLASQYSISSDVRIKTAIHATNGAEDLKSLLGIQITDYRHIDTVVNGNSSKKKVIAQQVESVYPIAVSKSRGVVPDIYRNAPFRDGWVEMVSSLKVGERVKLIGPSGESVTEVLEVKDGGFRTAFQPGGDKVFVYGREVSDFRSVDYDAIAMLNVSATQELARKLETVQAENVALRRELATQEQSMEARLIALERRMSGETAAKTVSLKTVSLETVKAAE
jgi:hypothetical protein